LVSRAILPAWIPASAVPPKLKNGGKKSERIDLDSRRGQMRRPVALRVQGGRKKLPGNRQDLPAARQQLPGGTPKIASILAIFFSFEVGIARGVPVLFSSPASGEKKELAQSAISAMRR
jgi:hypothetical protein